MVHVLLTALVLLLLAPIVVVVLWLIGVALYVAGFALVRGSNRSRDARHKRRF